MVRWLRLKGRLGLKHEVGLRTKLNADFLFIFFLSDCGCDWKASCPFTWAEIWPSQILLWFHINTLSLSSCPCLYPSFIPLLISLSLFLSSPPSSSKLCSFWMSRFYERSDKEKGGWRAEREGEVEDRGGRREREKMGTERSGNRNEPSLYDSRLDIAK